MLRNRRQVETDIALLTAETGHRSVAMNVINPCF